jgi:hypothetical protein
MIIKNKNMENLKQLKAFKITEFTRNENEITSLSNSENTRTVITKESNIFLPISPKIKLGIGVITLCFFSSFGFAQDNDGGDDIREKLTLGFKIGANYSNVYDAKGEDFNADAKAGLALGAFATLPLGRLIGLQPEVLFSQKGFKGTGNILGGSYKFTRTTNYLDIPLLFAFKPSEAFSLVFGPQYSYLMSQTTTFETASSTIEQEQEFENDNIRKNTLCLTLGADINVKHIVVSGRVGWDFQNNAGDGTSSTPRYKNTWAQLTLGYRFY